MKVLRRLLTALSCAIGLWAAASVAGVLFDPLRISFWIASLMWALLASLMMAPALVVMTDDTIAEADAEEPAPAGTSSRTEADVTATPSPPPVDEQPSFVDNARAAYPVAPEPEADAEDTQENKALWEYAQKA